MLLDDLHARYPALDFPRYEDRLRQEGIHYLLIASTFDANFYIINIGMVPAAAHIFCQRVAMVLKKEDQAQAGGAASILDSEDKENIEP